MKCRLPLAAVSIAVLSAHLGAQAETGRVVGSVTLTLATGSKSAATAYERRGVAPRAKPLPEIRSVVIFFTAIAPPAGMSPTRTSIAQKDEQFAPHLVAVTAGSTVAFPNHDPFFHNVFSLSRGATFDLGRYPSGATRSKAFRQPGIVKVFCHIHSHMSAVIRVFDHPWFTIPDERGAFAIDRVPPGEHQLIAWHERIGEQREQVTIRAGQTAEVNFTLPVLEPAK
jgi:plastocyanin